MTQRREATWEPTKSPGEMLVLAQGHGSGAGLGGTQSKSASHIERIAWA